MKMLVVDEMVEGVTAAGRLGYDVVGAEMNESPMSSETDVELVVAVTVEREEAVVNKPFVPPGGNDEELVFDVAA